MRFTRLTWLHIGLFVALYAAWAVALLSPIPDGAKEVFPSDFAVFLFGKTLHIGVYATITFIGATIAPWGRRWWLAVVLMLVHGIATECIQPYVNRTGSVRDVGLDTIGIALGGLSAWWFRRRQVPR